MAELTSGSSLHVKSDRSAHSPVTRAIWFRQLDAYPATAPKLFYLAIVVMATIILYYQLYVGGAVAPQILRFYGMSFHFYVYILVAANGIGAFTSVLAGFADRWGRANMVAYGLGVTGLLVLFGIPHASNEWSFAVITVAIGFVEGIVLVATPALVRDFSPQLGRASAMGFWTLGPVVGSLVVAVVATNTLDHLTAWQDQFVICGIVSLGVFAIALFGLRELSPRLRSQLMVSMRERALVEARAKGIDVAQGMKNPWRQMLHADIIVSAFAIALFLLVYYTAVGFGVIYLETIFRFSSSQANGINNWLWAFDAAGLVVVGIISDRLRVRKPFMLLGGLGAIAMTIVYLMQANDVHTGYDTLVWISSVLSIFLALAYAPWMASFTETVERRNPALVATGLAVWGWILRIVVAVSVLVLPFVVDSVTPIVQNDQVITQAQALVAKDPKLNAVVEHPALFNELAKYPNPASIPPALLKRAVDEIGLSKLTAIASDPNLAFFKQHAAQLASAQQALEQSPGQWQTWYWVCVGGQIAFIPLIFVMAGRWSPWAAKRDLEEREALVTQELAELEHVGTAT